MSIGIEYRIRLIAGPEDGKEFILSEKEATDEIIVRNSSSKDYKYRYKNLSPDGWYLYEYIGKK